MVPVVMAVGMLMFQYLVRVLVSVAFRKMEHYTRQHEHSAQQHQPSGGALSDGEGHGSTNEGCECEHRARSRRAKRPLGQKVKAQAQAITRSSHGEKSKCSG